ncbi:3-hydroxyacyl-CoA dehydrogenase/enoyl-CoA hydratase family protein [Alphaproteobacteria bacterium]|nr:3-hydroxyacyl-CoA dehydrogenase/enoyl-CoA hydratase family protein [Alphaproteobacteria bacterium]MDC0594296.1 3-hydroxyacyl-CoA dehydrogenase/enoyl-CoA hydratase family protein [Alphaproteobacteria bacterium]
MSKFNKIVVIGAGTMGSGIAAHLANSKREVVLLDLKGKETANQISENAIDIIKKSDPPLLIEKSRLSHIKPGNLTDDFDQIKDADWIIEAVVERIDIKHQLYSQIDKVRNSESIVSSNTSTIPLSVLTEEMSELMKSDFCITHFFNPVRFMRLLEIVETPQFDVQKLESLQDFCQNELGKGIVNCNDTPGFIGNRIGVYAMQVAMYEALERGLPVEIADALFGRPLGIPKTGVFGLYDLIGIDLMKDVLASFKKELQEDDPFMDVVKPHPIVEQLLDKGYTGNKGLGGFYKAKIVDGNEITKALNTLDMSYYDFDKVDLPIARRVEKEGMKALLNDDSKYGKYAFAVLSKIINYSAFCIPEVSSKVTDIDDALRMGFNWNEGPFELLNDYGLENYIHRLQDEGSEVPELLTTMARLKQEPYDSTSSRSYNHESGMKFINRGEGVRRLGDHKKYANHISRNYASTIWQFTDDARKQRLLVCEFHTKANALNGDAMKILEEAIARLESDDYQGLIVYNEAMNFSAGADLNTMIDLADQSDWKGIDKYLSHFQQVCKKMKYTSKPTISAVAGLAIGGGFEVACQTSRMVAHMNSTLGLVETGVGLVPGGGGCKELLWRWVQDPEYIKNNDEAALRVFDIIGYGLMAHSPLQAKKHKFFLPNDVMVLNRDNLLIEAFQQVFELKGDYQTPLKPQFCLSGLEVKEKMHQHLLDLEKKGFIFGYDVEIGLHLAHVLSGGETDKTKTLSEDDLYNLERQSLINLIQSQKTRDRIHAMLLNGRRLKN